MARATKVNSSKGNAFLDLLLSGSRGSGKRSEDVDLLLMAPASAGSGGSGSGGGYGSGSGGSGGGGSQGSGGPGGSGPGLSEERSRDDLAGVGAGGLGGGSGGGRPDGVGNGGGGGRPPGAGTKKGELFGDQIVLLRDLDPTGVGGNGEPLLDGNGQHIVVGYDESGVLGGDDGLFPIYFEADAEGDYEIPADMLPYVQEVELERANVARAPAKVQEKALGAALEKIASPYLKSDPAGRIMYSADNITFSTMDAPLENLAFFQYLMTTANGEWKDVTDKIDDMEALDPLLDDDPNWDPSALLGAAWSKEGKITLDAMLYENTTLGINKVTGSGESLQIDYFDFITGVGTEAYNHDREATYGSRYLQWIVYDEVTGEPEFAYGSVYDAVFEGQQWEDKYLALNSTGDDFIETGAIESGVNDFAQAADDSRAVINFIHANVASEIEALPTLVPEEGSLIGSADLLLG